METYFANHDGHAQGDSDARVTLVEYGDYECPCCGDADRIIKALQLELHSKLRFVFRNFPLREIHPHALNAAAFAEAAAEQDAFWPFHDLLFAHQDALTDDALVGYAETLGLDAVRLTKNLKGTLPLIDREMSEGVRIGIEGTPGFVVNGQLLEGGWDFEALRRAIDQAAGDVRRQGTPASMARDRHTP